jgi:hypothetical protein
VVKCTGKLDGAATLATVQIMEHDGRWRNYGNISNNAGKGPTIKVYDGAPGKKGDCHWYRMQYKHHGHRNGGQECLPVMTSRATRQCFKR